MAGGLNSPAVTTLEAGLSTQRSGHAGEARDISDIAPGNNRAAIASLCGSGVNRDAGIDARAGGLIDSTTALPASADQHGATAQRTGGIHAGVAGQGNIISRQCQVTSLAASRVRAQAAVADAQAAGRDGVGGSLWIGLDRRDGVDWDRGG